MRNLMQNFILRKCEKMISKNFPRSFFALGVDEGKPYLITSSRIHDFTGWWGLIKFTIRATPRTGVPEMAEEICLYVLLLAATVTAYVMT